MTQKSENDTKDQNAVALSRKGASQGGRARAAVLTKQERSAIARKAAEARWGKRSKAERVASEVIDLFADKEAVTDHALPEPSKGKKAKDLPHSMFQGKLVIGDVELECYVLSNGKRVMTQMGMVHALTGGGGP